MAATPSTMRTAAPRLGGWWDFLSGYLALATVDTPMGRLVLCSVHTPARIVDDPLVDDVDHRAVKRKNCERAWHNDLAFAALDGLPKERGFIFGGDWNTARLVDQQAGDYEGKGAGVEFFERAAERDWAESMREFYPTEVRTYLKPGTQPYENDHVFTDRALHERLYRCEVIAGLPVSEISDHAAVVVDFNVDKQ